MTFNVYYTDRAQPDSSFINRVWYDAKSSRLALELHGDVYEYNNVPPFVYRELVEAESAGTYYRTKVRSQYGPGSNLGSTLGMREMKVDVDLTKTFRDPGHPNLRLLLDSDGPLKFADGGTFAKDGTVTLPHLSLVQDTTDMVEYDHTVYFTVAQSDDEKTHTLKAASMDAALDAMFDLADKLDQDIEVKGVLVRFE